MNVTEYFLNTSFVWTDNGTDTDGQDGAYMLNHRPLCAWVSYTYVYGIELYQ